MKHTKLPDGLPPLPPVPEGYDKIELKGWGWSSNKKKVPYSIASKENEEWMNFIPDVATGIQRFYYIVAVKSPKKKVIVNKKGWISFKDQIPKKSDYPIASFCKGQRIIVWDTEDHPEFGMDEYWISLTFPEPPKINESAFETWWKSTGFKHGKKEALAAWDAKK